MELLVFSLYMLCWLHAAIPIPTYLAHFLALVFLHPSIYVYFVHVCVLAIVIMVVNGGSCPCRLCSEFSSLCDSTVAEVY